MSIARITKTTTEVKEALGGQVAYGLGLTDNSGNYVKSSFLVDMTTGVVTDLEGAGGYTATLAANYLQIQHADASVLRAAVVKATISVGVQAAVVDPSAPVLMNVVAAGSALTRLMNYNLVVDATPDLAYTAGNFVAEVLASSVLVEVWESAE